MAGARILSLNAQHLRVIASSRKKTDKRDAFWIAKSLQTGMMPHPVRVPTVEIRRLRSLLAQRAAIAAERKRWLLRARSYLRAAGVKVRLGGGDTLRLLGEAARVREASHVAHPGVERQGDPVADRGDRLERQMRSSVAALAPDLSGAVEQLAAKLEEATAAVARAVHDARGADEGLRRGVRDKETARKGGHELLSMMSARRIARAPRGRMSASAVASPAALSESGSRPARPSLASRRRSSANAGLAHQRASRSRPSRSLPATTTAASSEKPCVSPLACAAIHAGRTPA